MNMALRDQSLDAGGVLDTDAATTAAIDEVHAGDAGGHEGSAAGTVVDEAIERRARAIGWRPQEEWRGPAEKWKDAQTFVDFHDSVLPLVQRENKTLRTTLESANARLADLERKLAQQDADREKFRRDSLELEQRQALDNGDHARAAQISNELVDLKVKEAVRSVAPAPANADVSMVFETWVADKPEFQDQRLQRLFYKVGKEMREMGVLTKGHAFLDEVADQLRMERPDLFRVSGAAPRRSAMSEMGGSPGSSTRGARTWNDLKPEVREAFDGIIADDPSMGRDQKTIAAARQRMIAQCSDDHFVRR